MLSRCIVAFLITIMASSSSGQPMLDNGEGAGRTVEIESGVRRKLLAKGHTKVSIIDTLQTLAEAGMIKDMEGDDAAFTNLKRKFGEASVEHSQARTQYGPLVQSINLDADGMDYWEYMHPMAFLSYMSAVSVAFADMMRSICVDGRPLRIIIYADGLVPGNPFRPEASRKLMCIYWCIADWPQHILQRSFAWPVFSILRESIIHKITGGFSKLIRYVLRVFFPETGHSFHRGVHINHPDGGFVVTAIFAGFLQDLLGHKETTEWKGANGVYCCLTCDNVINMTHRAPNAARGEVATNCTNADRFRQRTDADVYANVDELIRDFMMQIWPGLVVSERNHSETCRHGLASIMYQRGCLWIHI